MIGFRQLSCLTHNPQGVASRDGLAAPRIPTVVPPMSQAPTSPEAPAPVPEVPQPPSSNRRSTWLVIAVAIAIVAIPLLTVGLPVEIAHWYLADAQVKQQAGEVEAAVAALDKALEYAPQDLSVHHLRCQILRECDRLEESLAAADRALELAPGDRAAHLLRGETLMKMERFSEAAAAIETAVDPDAESAASVNASMLNLLAYVRALAGENLDDALQEVNAALDLMQAAVRPEQELPGIYQAPLLDTRGLILYKQGKHEQALADLERAVAESDLRRIDHLQEAEAQILPPEELAARREQAKMNLAVMLYHRGLVHQAMQNLRQAEADYAKVRELGYEPNESLF
jgi:tetratricopeptide (TPR) repeat protein